MARDDTPGSHARSGSARAILLAVVLATAAAPARAYEEQAVVGVAAGWAYAPVLEAPNNGPAALLGVDIGFDDVWGLGIYASWAVHPPFNGGDSLQIGAAGAEVLYYLDILQVVPFFGAGIDVLPSYDGSNFGADFALHLRASLDYLVSREVVLGVDIRPYILLTNLELDPVYLTFLFRVGFVVDY